MAAKLLLIESIVRTILSVEQGEHTKYLLEQFARNIRKRHIKDPLPALERDGGREEEGGGGVANVWAGGEIFG